MQVETKLKEQQSVPAYPGVYRGIASGIVVLFTEQMSGVVLEPGKSSYSPGQYIVGFYSCTNIDPSDPSWVRLSGEVTLRF
ncbi:MAG: hypothetical protein QQN63_00710 [Nitrosopumilus sp.]